jgi:hypothetical protein
MEKSLVALAAEYNSVWLRMIEIEPSGMTLHRNKRRVRVAWL